MLLVELRHRADAVRTQELLLVEHARQDAPQPAGIDQRRHGPSGGIGVLRAQRVHASHQLRNVVEARA